MNSEKQKLLIEYLLSSADVFALTNSIIKADYFDPEYRSSVDFIKTYYNKYRDLPDLEQVYAEADVKYKLHELDRSKSEYCMMELEQYCKHKAMEHAILASPEMMRKGDYGAVENAIKEAVTTSLHRSVGVSFFENPEQMLADLADSPAISTGYLILDDYLGGGARRKEMILVSANSGGGKSLVMANMGLNFAQQKLVVLYISLELPVEMIWKRYASMVTDISQAEILYRSDDVIAKIKGAKGGIEDIYIEQMPVGTTANDIRAFLREFELKRKCVPDVLVLDYLDLMGPNEKVSADNVSEKDKRCSEQFRQILTDYNLVGITASQQNRSAVEASDLNHSHIAGGITKINTTDVYMSIIFNETMKMQGEIAFLLLKTRSSDGVGKLVYLKWRGVALRVLDSTKKHRNDEEKDNPINSMTAKHKNNNEQKLAKSARKSQLISMFAGVGSGIDMGDDTD